MGLMMLGIDHTKAELDVRTQFAFTKKQLQETLMRWKHQTGVKGGVIVSTCNRMEIYLSMETDICYDTENEILSWLCEEKQIKEEIAKQYVTIRREEEVAEHLFALAAGMKSLIMGEDQIITQVKEAVELSRESMATDTVLEVLFRDAISCGKEIKTKVLFSHGNLSGATEAIRQLKDMGYSFWNQTVLVIGNGKMGKIVAEKLYEEGAKVYVTIRQYHRGVVEIPKGANRILYSERYEFLPKCQYIFSATASPNVTITKEKLEETAKDTKQVFIDLAVPRDIDSRIGENHALFTIDDFSFSLRDENEKENIEQAQKILQENVQKFMNWYECRNLVPRVAECAKGAAEDITWRMKGNWRGLEQKSYLQAAELVHISAQKTIAHMLYRLRDELEPEEFRKCLDILEES